MGKIKIKKEKEKCVCWCVYKFQELRNGEWKHYAHSEWELKFLVWMQIALFKSKSSKHSYIQRASEKKIEEKNSRRRNENKV